MGFKKTDRWDKSNNNKKRQSKHYPGNNLTLPLSSPITQIMQAALWKPEHFQIFSHLFVVIDVKLAV